MARFKKVYKSDPVRFFRHFLLGVFLVAFLVFIVIIPYRVSLILGSIMGKASMYLSKSNRKVALGNLITAFPEKNPSEIRGICRKAFSNLGMNLVEFGLLNFRSKKFWLKRVDIEGDEILKKHLGQGKGVVYLTAHIGNWELMGAYLSMTGHPISVVARELRDKFVNSILVYFRKKTGVHTIYRDGRANTKRMVKALRNARVLGILIDQDTKVGGTFVDFFGREAYTPTAVAQFGRLKETVIIPGFISRRKNGSHLITVMPPVEKSGNDKVQTQRHTGIIESFIRKNPSQWVWMHPRWKRKKGVKKKSGA